MSMAKQSKRKLKERMPMGCKIDVVLGVLRVYSEQAGFQMYLICLMVGKNSLDRMREEINCYLRKMMLLNPEPGLRILSGNNSLHCRTRRLERERSK